MLFARCMLPILYLKMLMVGGTLFIHINIIPIRQKIYLIWTEYYSEYNVYVIALAMARTLITWVRVHHTNHYTTKALYYWMLIIMPMLSNYLQNMWLPITFMWAMINEYCFCVFALFLNGMPLHWVVFAPPHYPPSLVMGTWYDNDAHYCFLHQLYTEC